MKKPKEEDLTFENWCERKRVGEDPALARARARSPIDRSVGSCRRSEHFVDYGSNPLEALIEAERVDKAFRLAEAFAAERKASTPSLPIIDEQSLFEAKERTN